MILITNSKYSHKFIIERETFIYNLKKEELEQKSKYLNIKEEDDDDDICEYLKSTEASTVTPNVNIAKQFQSMDKLYQKNSKP